MPVGRPPKPSRIRELEGNRGRRPIPKGLHIPGQPIAPDYFDDEQKYLWRQIEHAMPAGVLTMADTQVLERMTVAWATFRECCRKIANLSMFARGSTGQLAMSPLVKIQALAAREMHQAGEVLGLSPVARARISAPESIDDDPLALLLECGVYAPVPKGPKVN